MNILYILRSFPAGSGVDAITRILSNYFSNKEHGVCICYCIDLGSHVFVDGRIKLFKISEDLNSLNTKNNIELLSRIVEQEKINIIINQESQNLPCCELCFAVKQNTNAKLIVVHHFSLLMAANTYISILARILPKCLMHHLKSIRELHRRNLIFSNSDIVVFLSRKYVEQYKQLASSKNILRILPDCLIYYPKDMERLRRKLPFSNFDYASSDKLYAIANPLENSCKEPPNFETKNKTVIFVARMVEAEKRPSLALKVWKLLHKENPEWNLLFLGNGKDLPIIREKAKDLPRVEFLGFQNPVPYYEKSSILLQTSAKDFEGFPVTLIESLQNACIPVVMDSFLSLSDIIEDGKNGFITPNNDTKTMARKVQILMRDESLRKEIALNGIQSVKKFDVEIIAQEWEKLFNEL
jgi:glycosyltransferase involved in cell wall biosynthesis